MVFSPFSQHLEPILTFDRWPHLLFHLKSSISQACWMPPILNLFLSSSLSEFYPPASEKGIGPLLSQWLWGPILPIVPLFAAQWFSFTVSLPPLLPTHLQDHLLSEKHLADPAAPSWILTHAYWRERAALTQAFSLPSPSSAIWNFPQPYLWNSCLQGQNWL